MKSAGRILVPGTWAFLASLCIGAQPVTADTGARKLPNPVISEELTIPQKAVTVLGSRITYLELGKGDAVVFVHGNPTSSYLWRNVLPHVAKAHRAIAIDLIGMGGSAKPNIAYSFEDHYKYFAGFLNALAIQKMTLVGHDWGAALVWEFARRNPARVARLAFMEGVLPPAFPAPSFKAMGEEMGNMFRAFKDPAEGPRIVMDENMFVEKILPGFVNRTLGDKAMHAYRAPFLSRDDRWTILAWPRQVPIAGEPAETTRAMNAIAAFMTKTTMPVLLLYAEPGVIVPPAAVAWYTKKIAKLETSFVGQGFHFIQEDQPDAVGRALTDWMRRNRSVARP